MGEFQLFAVLVPFILLLASPNVRSAASSDKPVSFSIRLIDKYSPESPFYQGNLTFLERIERYANDSEARVSYLKSIISPNDHIDSRPHLISPYVRNNGFVYVAEVRVGEPAKYFFFLLDTGSTTSWVLCKSYKYFNPYKNTGFFNPYRSNTFSEVKCGDRACDGLCKQGKCPFEATYGDGEKAEGYYVRDNFGFKAPKEADTTFRDVLFVCADPDKTQTEYMVDAKGILSMGPDPKSFTSQLSLYTNSRFSYCLVPPKDDGPGPMSFLKFGNDMGYKGPKVQTTKFLKLRNYRWYFLNLVDISVDGKRLNYPPGAFLIYPKSGFFIDSGCAISNLDETVYWKLHDAFMVYFTKFQLRRRENCPGGVRGKSGIQLCYVLPDDFTSIPSMTYHFKDANLRIAPEQTMIVDRASRLLMLAVGLDEANVLGAYQQHNTRFVFDNKAKTLSFVPENCERDPPP